MAVVRRPPKALRFIHTSDVHLESDTFGLGPHGEAFRQNVRRAFSSVIRIANRNQADLLLIVGDLFDSSRISDEGLDFAMGEIAQARMPVVMVPGNHDAHDDRSIYAAVPGHRLPSNLHLILDPDGRTIEFPDLNARIWGRALVEHSPDYRPLMGIPEPAHDKWNIALAHGLFIENGEWPGRSSPITPTEIEQSDYDYIALGHVHAFGDVSRGTTRAAYCGTPAPLYSSGEAGAVIAVECVPGEPIRIERIVVEH